VTITINIKKLLAREICCPSSCNERNPDIAWVAFSEAPENGCTKCVLEYYKADNEHSETDFDEWLAKADHLDLRIIR